MTIQQEVNQLRTTCQYLKAQLAEVVAYCDQVENCFELTAKTLEKAAYRLAGNRLCAEERGLAYNAALYGERRLAVAKSVSALARLPRRR
jgi:hypothetical protein